MERHSLDEGAIIMVNAITPHVTGPTSGILPNVHFRGISMEALRSDPAFVALPPVEHLTIASPQCYRYVRQDSPLWRALHAGVLTSGTLNGALGFCEPTGVARLGLPRHFISHRPLLSAYNNLRMPQYVPMESMPQTSSDSATVYNRAAVEAHNAELAAASAAAGRRDHNRQLAAPPAAGSRSGTRRASKGGGGGGLCEAAAATAWAAREQRVLATARRLSASGLSSVRMSWGGAQEAASLYDLVSLFPDATVSEVGLCMVRQDLIPTEWGIPPGSLPPIGASPDVMLLHRNSSSHASSPAVTSVKSQAAVSQAFSPPTAGEGAAGRTDTLAGRLTGVPSTSGAASTDADTARPKAAPLSDSIEHLLQQLQAQQAAAATQPNAQLRVPPPPHPIGHGTPAAGASPAMHAAGVFEMVEVKNTSPFGTASGGSVLDKKGKARPHFTLWDKGPRTQVPCYWVPQLQMEMLASNTQSIILLTRSATKGSNLFRMQKDDEFLRLMLLHISALQVQHVVPGIPPKPDAFAMDSVYQALLSRTLQVVANTQCLSHIPCGSMPRHKEAVDSRLFL